MQDGNTIEHVDNFQQLIKYNVNDAKLAEIKEEALSIKVSDFNDKENYELARQKKSELRKLRISVEETRKDLKKDALEFGRKVDARAKELTAPIVESEEHLKSQMDIVDAEILRQKQEAERKAQEEADRLEKRYISRVKELSSLNFTEFDDDDLRVLSDDEYQELAKKAKEDFNQQQVKHQILVERLESLAQYGMTYEDRDVLQGMTDAEFAELINEAQELKAKQEAEEKQRQQELEESRKREAEKDAELARLRAEAQERDRIEQERIAKEKAEQEAKERAEREEQERIAREEAERKAEQEREEYKTKLADYLANKYPDYQTAIAGLNELYLKYNLLIEGE